MAEATLKTMKDLTKAQKTIICTIHQPSSELFEMFDKICFLSNGHLAFLGSRYDAKNFFERYLFILRSFNNNLFNSLLCSLV
jgi:ATP-binding cassette, subfamily G (WHITE), eye pigment precursor transporter